AQIIDLSRLQADDPLASPQEVDIDQVLAEAIDRTRVDAERHQVSLTVAGTKGCQVLGNARQLGVAVSNLVENAVIYSDPGARVVVAARLQAMSDDDYVEITVSDNGIGIAAGDQQRIFERFYRVDYARSRANGGTGLGLSIVKHIAATHGGEVSVWSQPGRGSTFTIRIPAHLHAEPVTHATQQQSQAQPESEPPTGAAADVLHPTEPDRQDRQEITR
ncbi:MAG: ATP-binding protein, partial [Propionibacteriaceae bacterium]